MRHPSQVPRVSSAAPALFEALREKRRELAAAGSVPPYVIFHDSTLREIAAVKPATLNELARVPGVGETKLERYGEAMLEAVRANQERGNDAAA